MSMKVTRQIALIISFVAAAFVYLSAAGAQAQKVDQIRGKVVEIDLNHHTLTLETDEHARDTVFWVDQSTPLSNCGTGLYGNISELKAGEEVIVSYYEVNSTFYTISISPSGAALGDC